MDTTEFQTMAQSLRTLMQRLEDLMRILHQERIVYFPDWGTLLGVERHKNVIPWDYDVDICLPASDYKKLIAHFESAGGQIGQLVLRKTYYDDPEGAVAILFADVPDESLGIDVVSYHVAGDRVLNDMSAQLQADYPGDYDLPLVQTLPLQWSQLLGLPIPVPTQTLARLAHLFGDWRAFPDGHQPGPLTAPPLVTVPDLAGKAGDGTPWIVRGTWNPAWETRRDGALWARPGFVDGMRMTWWIAQADADAAGLTVADIAAMSFTELVFHADRALWGRVHVATLFPGDTLVAPLPGISHTFTP